jgi:hypothetical protein
MPVYDELYKFKDELQHVLVRRTRGMLHKDMQEQQEK